MAISTYQRDLSMELGRVGASSPRELVWTALARHWAWPTSGDLPSVIVPPQTLSSLNSHETPQQTETQLLWPFEKIQNI